MKKPVMCVRRGWGTSWLRTCGRRLLYTANSCNWIGLLLHNERRNGRLAIAIVLITVGLPWYSRAASEKHL